MRLEKWRECPTYVPTPARLELLPRSPLHLLSRILPENVPSPERSVHLNSQHLTPLGPLRSDTSVDKHFKQLV